MRGTLSRIVTVSVAALVIASCGGGGGVESTGGAQAQSALASMEARALRARGERHAELFATPVSVVNTTIQGEQVLRAIGATDDGGYTVAWLSGFAGQTLSMQHYDSRGERDGAETLIALSLPEPDYWPESTRTSSALAALADGSIVVVYVACRPTPEHPTAAGLLLQRFDANGMQVLAETRVSSQQGSGPGSRGNVLDGQQAAPLADGGFVVGWTIWDYSILGTRYSLWLQRFDAQAQPVGALVAAGVYWDLRYEIEPDSAGGFTLRTSSYRITGPFDPPEPLQSTTRFDAAMQPGPELAVPVPSGAVVARELADGTYIGVFRTDDASFSGQRYSRTGAPLGDPFAIRIAAPPGQAASFQIAALAGSGFALAWTGQSPAGDSDVFTQAFVQSERDRVKACREAAKVEQLKGKDRRAFIENCAG